MLMGNTRYLWLLLILTCLKYVRAIRRQYEKNYHNVELREQFASLANKKKKKTAVPNFF